jgi:hypothetical protein
MIVLMIAPLKMKLVSEEQKAHRKERHMPVSSITKQMRAFLEIRERGSEGRCVRTVAWRKQGH